MSEDFYHGLITLQQALGHKCWFHLKCFSLVIKKGSFTVTQQEHMSPFSAQNLLIIYATDLFLRKAKAGGLDGKSSQHQQEMNKMVWSPHWGPITGGSYRVKVITEQLQMLHFPSCFKIII